jgi:hypothetical protein
MDPLSIALGVIALLELTKKVIVYAKQTKDAPTDRTKILQEAASLMGLLIMLKEFIEDCDDSEDSWLQATSSLTAPDGPLQQYKLLLETVVAKITPSRGQRKFGQALAWIFSKEEVTRLLSQIERVKSFVKIALEIDHTFVSLLFFLLPLGKPRPKCYTINANQLKSRWYQQNSHSEPPRDVLQDLSLSLVQRARMGSEADGTTTITTEGHGETFCKIGLSHWHTVYKDSGIIGSRADGGSADRRESASTAT